MIVCTKNITYCAFVCGILFSIQLWSMQPYHPAAVALQSYGISLGSVLQRMGVRPGRVHDVVHNDTYVDSSGKSDACSSHLNTFWGLANNFDKTITLEFPMYQGQRDIDRKKIAPSVLFLLGHEAAHLRPYNRLLQTLSNGFDRAVTLVALMRIANMSSVDREVTDLGLYNRFLRTLGNGFAKAASLVALIRMPDVFSKRHAFATGLEWQFGRLASQRLSQLAEKNADKTAASKLFCADGGIALFKACLSHGKPQGPTHPAYEERIAYLERIKEKQMRARKCFWAD